MTLYGLFVTRWDYNEDRLYIEYRAPYSEEITEYQTAIREYVYGRPINPISGRDYLDKYNRTHPNFRGRVHRAYEVGQMWTLAHEIAHSLKTNCKTELSNTYLSHRLTAERVFEADDELGPITVQLWSDEVASDLSALDMIFPDVLAMVCAASGPCDLNYAREEAASALCAGVRLACDSIDRLDVASSHRIRQNRLLSHPPVTVRWKFLSQHIKLLADTDREVDLLLMATIIERLSGQIPHK